MGKQQKYMPYPVFRISGFGKDQRYGKQRKTGESFGIYHAVGGDESPLYVSETVRRQGQMESVGHRLSHWKHCADRFLCGGVRMDPLLFCKISDRAESGFRF